MENHSTTPNKSSKGGQKNKIVAAVLVLLLIAVGVAFIFKYIESEELANQNAMTQGRLDQAYDQLDSMSNELDTRILKIAQLGGEIDTLLLVKSQLEDEKKAIRKNAYKQVSALQDKVSGYKEILQSQDLEIERLKVLNDSLFAENKGLKKETNKLNTSINDLNKSKSQLEEKVAMASQLKIEGFRVLAVSSSDKEKESPFKNRHIDHLKISFDVLENRVAPIEGKGILVKITDPDNNVIFDVASGSGTFVFEGRENFYTTKQDILFDRNSQSMVFLYNKGTDYVLGTHKVEVYTEDYLMGKGAFIVK